MTNREKAKQILEQTFGHEIETRFINSLKGCDFIKNTECNNYQDCENCKLYHFWYNEFNGQDTPANISKEEILKQFKIKLRDVIQAESVRENAEGEYIYSITEEKLFGKITEIIFNTTLE